MMKNKETDYTAKQIMIRKIIAFCGFIFLIALDQLAKWVAAKQLKDGLSLVFIPKILNLQYIENRGAAFGILQNSRILFLVITVLVCLVSIYIISKILNFRKFNLLTITMIIFLAGGIGNFIDRLFRHYVIDFLEFDFVRFPIFNVADIYVTLSLTIFVILMFFVYKDKDFDGILFPKKEK